jgi:hypothetical protein
VEKIARELGVDFTFGGWGEDRSHLWRGHYHDPNVMRHLGVDYNVPAETLVVAPAEMTVINAWPDPDQDGGWGGQLIVKLAKPYRGADYVIFGHLAHDSLPAVGKTFAAAEPFAVLGGAHENGGWFPHLHVQCFTQKIYDKYALDLTKIDGYGLNGEPLEPDFPDPTGLVAGTD